MRAWIHGMGEGEIVDIAQDSTTGDFGFAVRYPSGLEELVCPGLVYSLESQVNPTSLALPALGSVELQERGLPDVVALRGEKIPKYQQLSSILGVPVAWEPKGRIGFYVEDESGIVPLGYSFREALANGLTYTDQSLSPVEFERLVEQSDLLKWGAIPGTVAGSFNPNGKEEEEEYKRELAVAWEAIQREEEQRAYEGELAAAYAQISKEEMLNPALRFPAMSEREGMIVQSILFPLDEWSETKAKSWLKKKGFKHGRPDLGETVIRFRQVSPDEIEPGTWSTIEFGESGIQAVVGIPVGDIYNPWGVSTDGERVLWARLAGPSREQALQSATGQQVRYYFPGEAGSPDFSRGGYWLGDRYLGRSFGDAYSQAFGAPASEIESGTLKADLAKIGAIVLDSGISVFGAVSESKNDFNKFLQFLTDKERQEIAHKVFLAGYSGGLEALHQQLSDTLFVWSEARGYPLQVNPPRYLEVVGRTGPLSVSVDTTTGEIEGSDQYKGLGGLVVGPDLEYQRALMKDIETLKASDFSSAKEGWDQFYNFNSKIADRLYGTARAPDIAILDERDRTGAIFEGITEYYERPRKLETLEETVKYIINKEGVRSWDQFPSKLLRESLPGFADWLQVPPSLSVSKEAALLVPEISLSGVDVADRELERSLIDASARFRLIRAAIDVLQFMQSRGLLLYEDFKNISQALEQVVTGGLPFDYSDFDRFASELLRRIAYGEEEIPF